MKQGNALTRTVMILLAVALAVYLGAYAFRTFHDPFSTTYAYNYTVNDSAEADGILIREEQVLPTSPGIVEMIRAEGEKVAVGKTVAMVYRDNAAMDAQTELEALELEIELLEYAAAPTGGVESAAQQDEEILQSLVALRARGAVGDYGALEESVRQVKSAVLKRAYTYGSSLSQEALEGQLQQLRSQQAALKLQTEGATTRVTAPASGIFSAQVDGYESTLTPETALTLTPSSLSALLGQSQDIPGTSAGKLITSNTWYFAFNLDAETAQRLTVGGTVTVRFSGEFSQDVDMEVCSLSQPENGQVTAVVSSDRYLGQTTLLRRQTAELIFQSYTGIRVPKAALRMLEWETTDQETGEVTQHSALGVYVLTGGRAEFKTAEVVLEGSDYYVLRASDNDADALRAGDEVIVRGLGLKDGMLLEG